MSSNQGAWLTATGAPLKIEPSPQPDPQPHQVAIKCRAVAINPVDWAMQAMGQERFSFIKYPAILGHDVAGQVTAVGSAVNRIKVGDRVFGLALGGYQERSAAFQHYTLLAEDLCSPLPDHITFEEASVIPLGLSTAASALFQKEYLALPHPSVEPKPLGKSLLIWSGASSVGCNAIQLAVAAGCDVVTTCSPKNFELVKKLGASHAFDYNSDTVVADILTYLKDKTIAGAIAIGNINAIRAGHGMKAAAMVLEIVSKAKGNRFVAMSNHYDGDVPEGVESKFILGDALVKSGVGAAVYADYLPKALAIGSFIPAPEPLTVGKGLESIEHAFEVQKRGVSAKKVVVSL